MSTALLMLYPTKLLLFMIIHIHIYIYIADCCYKLAHSFWVHYNFKIFLHSEWMSITLVSRRTYRQVYLLRFMRWVNISNTNTVFICVRWFSNMAECDKLKTTYFSMPGSPHIAILNTDNKKISGTQKTMESFQNSWHNVRFFSTRLSLTFTY